MPHLRRSRHPITFLEPDISIQSEINFIVNKTIAPSIAPKNNPP